MFREKKQISNLSIYTIRSQMSGAFSVNMTLTSSSSSFVSQIKAKNQCFAK